MQKKKKKNTLKGVKLFPPYSYNVANTFCKRCFLLLDKHFPRFPTFSNVQILQDFQQKQCPGHFQHNKIAHQKDLK